MSDRTVEALVTALVWLVVVLVVRWVARKAFERWERRLAARDAAGAARLRTTFSVLQRIIVAAVAVIGVWSVLSIFPQTSDVARALLASSAVLAVFAGLALNTPLGNLGSGLLVAFTQPLRLGDRVTIGEQTGFVEQINLIYTQLVTDDDRRIFVPNTQLTTSAIVNRTIKDPRRAVTATLPVRLGAPLDGACAALYSAAARIEGTLDHRVTVGEVGDRLVWLNVTAFAALDADVAALASQIREAGVAALADAGALPTQGP
jgi:small-conductance mechanosensitive channel